MRKLDLLLMVLLVACASGQKKKGDWVESPNIDNKKICALGEGSSYSESDAKARNALLAIFRTKIEAITSQEKSLSSDSGLKSSQKISFNQEISGVIEGSKIDRRKEKSSRFYSLACAQKEAIANQITSKIKSIDSQLSEYEAEQSAWNTVKARNLLTERTSMANSLEIVDSFVSPAPIDYDDIQSWKSREDSKKKIFLRFNDNFPIGIKNNINDQIHALGFKVAPIVIQANSHIKGHYKMKKEHYNVKGFDRYRIFLNLKGYNQKYVQQGSFSKEYVVVARSPKQVYEQIAEKMKNDINHHLADLKI